VWLVVNWALQLNGSNKILKIVIDEIRVFGKPKAHDAHSENGLKAVGRHPASGARRM
jgi:hypothetical protein